MEMVGPVYAISSAGGNNAFERFSNSARVHSKQDDAAFNLLHVLLHPLNLQGPMHVSGLVELISPAKSQGTATLYQAAKMKEPPLDPFVDNSTPYAVHAVLPTWPGQRSTHNT